MSSLSLRVLRVITINNSLKQILLEKPNKDILIRPGDYILISDLNLPIMDVMDMHGVLRILTIYEGDIPNAKFAEIEKTRPSKGTISVIGSIQNQTIATLRLNGYEVFNNYVKKSNLVIITEPKIQQISNKEKILVAPIDSLGLSEYQKLNTLLKEIETGITYNLNRPITGKKDLLLDVNYFQRKIYVKSLINSYYLRVTDGAILSTIEQEGAVIAISNKKKIIVASSVNLIFPFDLIYKQGENSLFLLDIIEKQGIFGATETTTKKKKPKKTKKLILDRNETRIEINNLDPTLVFQKIITILTRLGAVVFKRDDANRKADLKITPPIGNINLQISAPRNALIIKCLNCTEEELRNFRAITSLIELFITDLSQEHINKEKIKLLIRALATLHKKLLIAKDMLELDINAGEIQNELREAYATISNFEFLKEIANEIIEYCRTEEIDPLKPYPPNIKQKLLSKIDEWYEKSTSLSEKNI